MPNTINRMMTMPISPASQICGASPSSLAPVGKAWSVCDAGTEASSWPSSFANFGEEFIGERLGRRVEQALANLGEAAAHGHPRFVGEGRAVPIGPKLHHGLAAREPGRTPLTLALEGAGVPGSGRGRMFDEGDLAVEARLQGSYFQHRAGLEGILRDDLHLLAAGDRGVEDVWVVQCLPDRIGRRGNAVKALKFHRKTAARSGTEWLVSQTPRGPGPPRLCESPASPPVIIVLTFFLTSICKGRK